MIKYVYRFARYPRNYGYIQNQFNAAAERLSKKMTQLELPEGSVSSFIKAYWTSNLKNLQGSLQRSLFLLAWVLSPYFWRKDLGKITLIDYGGGSGILSLLAKEIGVGTVVYNDIHDVCCHDAEYIGKALNLQADHYVNGDVDGLLSYLNKKKITCGSVVSFDTIEHIYDLDDFLAKIIKVTTDSLVLMLASSANHLNPIISRRLMNIQRKMEFEGKTKNDSDDPRDTGTAYVLLRRKIIDTANIMLDDQEKDLIALKTRGMRKDHILNALMVYSTQKKLPQEPDHATNTCDPITGNWCERLMNPFTLMNKLSKKGFSTRVMSGYYGSGGEGSYFKKLMRLSLNIAISLNEDYGLKFSPFYCIYAIRNNIIK